MATPKSMRYMGAIAVVLLGFVPTVRAQETLAGMGAASGMAAGLGAMAATNVRPGAVAGRVPNFPGAGGDDTGGGAGGAGAATSTTTRTTTRIVRFNSISGQTFLKELLGARGTSRVTVTRRGRSARAQATYARRLAYLTPRQRSRSVLGKYRVPPIGWRAYYLPQDRYKFGKVWQYVTIEDDSAAYPVKYYYKPNSSSMLRLLSVRPRKGQPRANRVIGFRSWQDAMLAGYRPDPISRPEPAGDIVYLARLSRSPQLARYVEYLYAGQVTPSAHQFNMAYVRQVETVVNSRRDTRRYMRSTVAKVMGAVLGENPLPTTVGATPRVVSSTSTTTRVSVNGMPPMAASSMPVAAAAPAPTSAADKREENFNQFGSRAGKLANVPGNR